MRKIISMILILTMGAALLAGCGGSSQSTGAAGTSTAAAASSVSAADPAAANSTAYEVPEGSRLLPILGFVGFMIVFSWKVYLAPATVVAAFGGHWGNFIARFLLWIFGVGFWPVVIKKLTAAE